MTDTIINYITENSIELTGFVLGIAYVLLAIRQSVWCWIFGIGNVSMSILVFYNSALYGDMALNIFYLLMSFYGLYAWLWLKRSDNGGSSITTTPKRYRLWLLLFTAGVTAGSGYLLTFTDNTIPWWDGLTTALGLAATWMTARKLVENWLVWIFTDLLCAVIYIYKGLYPTSIYYFIMAMLAIQGYYKWKKELKL